MALGFFRPKQGQGFKPSAAHLYYTQRLFEYPTGRALDAVRFTHERVNI